MPKHDGNTLALLKFKIAVTKEIRAFRYSMSAYEYATRWWNEDNRVDNYDLITDYPGDTGRLFWSIKIKAKEYLSLRPDIESFIRGNTLININTAFEYYLSDVLKRAVIVKPSILSNSGMELQVSEVISHDSLLNLHKWVGSKVIDKYIRNKSHLEMISWIDRNLLCGIVNGQKSLVDEWVKWYSIRNELIHSGREISQFLQDIWPEKFVDPRRTIPVQLEDFDITSCHTTAYSLAKAIDQQVLRTAIGKEDAMLYARELFCRDGLEDPGEIARRVGQALCCNFNKIDANRALAIQRKSPNTPSDYFDFTPEMMNERIAAIEIVS